MAKIHQAYQSLLKHSEKREMLEKSARAKLQAVIINLSDANKVTIFAPKLKKKKDSIFCVKIQIIALLSSIVILREKIQIVTIFAPKLKSFLNWDFDSSFCVKIQIFAKSSKLQFCKKCGKIKTWNNFRAKIQIRFFCHNFKN